jgi:membrane protein required for colicin V production
MIISGVKSGIISQLLSVAGIAIGVALAYNYGEEVGVLLKINSEFSVVAGFAIIFIVSVVVAAIVAHFLSKVFSFAGLAWVNKLLGAIFAVIKGVVVLGLLYTAIYSLNEHLKVVEQESFNESISFNVVRKATQPLIDHWDNIKETAINKAKL